ncbi:MAG TPA: 3-hydroxyacyl-ACP dehydratase FabZ family protein [Lacipirellulaceae bacterium]
MSRAAIERAIPHRKPFLLLDEIVEQSEKRIVCRKRFTGDEFWYRGHYPDFPLTPGVLLCEAAMQAGAVLLARRVGRVCETHHDVADGGSRSSTHPTAAIESHGVPVVTRMNNVKFKAMVRPGDTVDLEVELVERMADAFFMNAKVTVDGKAAVTFDFACKMAAPN